MFLSLSLSHDTMLHHCLGSSTCWRALACASSEWQPLLQWLVLPNTSSAVWGYRTSPAPLQTVLTQVSIPQPKLQTHMPYRRTILGICLMYTYRKG